MRSLLRRYALYMIIFLIGLLLLGNIYLIDRNNTIINENKSQQEEAAKIKVSTSEIIRNVHFLDMTLRGYGLRLVDHYRRDLNKSPETMKETYAAIEARLILQHYPMAGFYAMKDSIGAYCKVVEEMRGMLERGERDQFLKILAEDRGYKAWKAYDIFSKDVLAFEDKIGRAAEERYNATLRNSYLLQIFLFFVIIPTLGYTAYFTRRSLKLTEQLRKAEADQNEILENQNQVLEQRVLERTFEIQAKNEEIVSRNHKLLEATKIIEDQSEFIRHKNDELEREVARQTQDLQQTNLELIEHNNRLEKFAFVISHNLRAPITRLVGLSNVLNLTTDATEQRQIVRMLIKSTHELDEVIADLNQILLIQKPTTGVFQCISLDALILKMRSILESELTVTGSELLTDFRDVTTITSLPHYVESIFYNLISNAIKYRHPDRPPVIRISAERKDNKLQIAVSDNGLGIDVERNRSQLFNLYKRFHFHVEGKGLGLYLVKTQVNALGGTIEVSSKLEEGTIFTILLNN